MAPSRHGKVGAILFGVGILMAVLFAAWHRGSEPDTGYPTPDSLAGAGGAGSAELARELQPVHVRASELPDESTQVTLPAPLDLPGNPAIAVFEPVGDAADDELCAAGAGFARWLYVAVAGQPAMGRQPGYGNMQRIAVELQRGDLRLSAGEAIPAAAMVGATHLAVGRIDRSGPAITLTYTVIGSRTKKPLGGPISVSGTPSQVAAQLPRVARQISARLGVPYLATSAIPAASAEDLTALGRFTWQAWKRLPYARLQVLEGLAMRSPVAGLVAMDAVNWQDPSCLRPIVRSTVKLAPGNVQVLDEAARLDPYSVAPVSSRLKTLVRRYPNNYLLIRAQDNLVGSKPGDAVKLIRRTVRIAPDNPTTWVAYCSALMKAGQDVRRSKVYADLTPDEEAFVRRVYPEAEAAARRAVRLDPQYGYAWRQLATAAQFNGSDDVAEDAYWIAVHLDREDPQLYFWGLEMFQPKWRAGGAKSLARVAQLAALEVFDSPAYARQTAGILRDVNHVREANIQYDRAVALYRDLIRERPRAAWLQVELATTLNEMGRELDAIGEYKAILARFPSNDAAHYRLGGMYYERGQWADAEREYRAVLRRWPNYAEARCRLGGAIVQQKRWKEGEALVRAGLKGIPNWSHGHESLGYALHMQHRLPEAIAEYRTALRLEPTAGVTWDRLTRALNEARRYGEAVEAGEHGAIYNREYSYALCSLAEAYLGAERYEESADAFSRYLRQMNGDAGAHMLYATALFKLGRNGEAVNECNTCIRLMPNSPAAGIARKLLKQHGSSGSPAPGDV